MDGEMPRCYEEERLQARKPHRCDECRGTIDKGETYVQATGLWEGRWYRYRYHACCAEGRQEILADMDYGDGISMDQGITEELHNSGLNRNDDGWDLYPT